MAYYVTKLVDDLKSALSLDIRFSMWHGTGVSLFCFYNKEIYEVRCQYGRQSQVNSHLDIGGLDLLGDIESCRIFNKASRLGGSSLIVSYEPKASDINYSANFYTISVIEYKDSPYKDSFELQKLGGLGLNWYKVLKFSNLDKID